MIKFIAGWMVCFVLRLMPFRPPNVEPILTTIMPFSKNCGWHGSFLFGLLSIVIFDIVTGKVGNWTAITGLTYGALGVLSYFFFKNRQSSALNYLKFAVFGTLLYDAVTGVILGPIMFGMPIQAAFVGQIPFTINHLLGNIVLSLLFSPALYKWVVANPNFSPRILFAKLRV